MPLEKQKFDSRKHDIISVFLVYLEPEFVELLIILSPVFACCRWLKLTNKHLIKLFARVLNFRFVLLFMDCNQCGALVTLPYLRSHGCMLAQLRFPLIFSGIVFSSRLRYHFRSSHLFQTPFLSQVFSFAYKTLYISLIAWIVPVISAFFFLVKYFAVNCFVQLLKKLGVFPFYFTIFVVILRLLDLN